MKPAAPCQKCKCAVFFNRDREPVCANCEKPGRHKLYLVVCVAGGYEWRVLEKERQEHEARLLAERVGLETADQLNS